MNKTILLIVLYVVLISSYNCAEKEPNISIPISEVKYKISDAVNSNLSIDQNPGIDFYQNKMYFLGGNGAMWNSKDNPKLNGWQLRIGTTIDDLILTEKPRMAENFPNYNTTEAKNDWCYYWLMGLWIDQSNGIFYSIAYSEYNYQESKWEKEAKERRLGLAKSVDKGLTWTYEGDIITQDKSLPPPVGNQYYGVGDICMFIPADNYIYVFYKKGFYSLSTLNRTEQSICVARCRIEDKLAPGKWFKFFNDDWKEPGLGGKESILFPNTNIISISFNQYLKKFVGIGNSSSGDTFISFAENMEMQKWTKQDFTFPDVTLWYCWQINQNDKRNPYIMDQSFRLYTTGVNQQGERPSYYSLINFIK